MRPIPRIDAEFAYRVPEVNAEVGDHKAEHDDEDAVGHFGSPQVSAGRRPAGSDSNAILTYKIPYVNISPMLVYFTYAEIHDLHRRRSERKSRTLWARGGNYRREREGIE